VPEAEAAVWDEATFDAALERAAEGVIEARGVRLSSDQLRQLLDELPRDRGDRDQRLLQEADFSAATFSGRADFRATTFSGPANFRGTTFSGPADFRGTTFSGHAFFAGAAFSGPADFNGARFGRDAAFDLARFSRDANFDEATFSGDAFFIEATFTDTARFSATFRGDARFLAATFSAAFFLGATFIRAANFTVARFSGVVLFDEATFSGPARFGRATFGGDADFNGATSSGDVDFNGARFEHARELGPVLASGELVLNEALFAQPVRIVVSARRVSLVRAVFRAGADVFVRWAEVSLEDADFGETSLLAELPPTPGGERSFLSREEPVAEDAWMCRLDAAPLRFAPSVVSARRAKVGRLTLSGVDLRACRFAGAHGLDALRLERVRFTPPPSERWDRLRWTRRQTIAEEHHWRAEHGHGRGWYEGEVRAPDWLAQASEPPEPEQIAGIYRDLRKGLEDNKDEPGAADFYYGEMEMRRHSGVHRHPGAPRDRPLVSLLWLYWLVSGYGLRASRALIALAVTIALGAVLLDLFGFEPGRGPDNGTLLFALESSISLLRAPEAKLTAGGEVIQIALRLAGPLFFGLALLALRGRVKR
jgi:hypothetical protein